jgi:hypothetical protein
MPETSNKFFRVDDKSGIVLSVRDGKFSLCSGYINKKGEVKLNWGFQNDNGVASDKFTPVAPRIGTIDTALTVLTQIIQEINDTLDAESGDIVASKASDLPF